MAVLILSLMLMFSVLPALFFLDRLFTINFERGASGVFWEPRRFAGSGKQKNTGKKRSLRDALAWIFKTPGFAEEDLAAYRNLMFYRISLAFGSVFLAAILAYFLTV